MVRPRHCLPAHRSSVCYTARRLLPTIWSADHSFSLPACRPSVCPILQAGPYLILVRRPRPFLPTCRPSVCSTACWLLPTFDSGPLTPSLSHGPPAVRLSYCPPAPTLLLVCRPRPAGRPSVLLPLAPTYDLVRRPPRFVPASRPPVCNSPHWHPRLFHGPQTTTLSFRPPAAMHSDRSRWRSQIFTVRWPLTLARRSPT